MTTITSQTCLKFGQIGQRTAKLAALERLEKMGKCCEHSSIFIFDSIIFILAGNEWQKFVSFCFISPFLVLVLS